MDATLGTQALFISGANGAIFEGHALYTWLGYGNDYEAFKACRNLLRVLILGEYLVPFS